MNVTSSEVSNAPAASPGPAPMQRRFGWRRRLLSGLVVAGVVLAVVGVGLFARSNAASPSDSAEVPPLPVAWFVPEQEQGYDVLRSYVGRVEATKDSALGFEIGGTVVDVRVDEGDEVPAGALVAVVDTQRLEAQRVELQAALEQARADLTLAELTLARVERVRQRDAATKREFDEATSGEASARAAVARAEAALASLAVDLSKAELVAPFDAVVADRIVDPGRVVAAGSTVVRLLASESPRVRLSLGGNAAQRVALGDAVEVDVQGQAVAGEVAAILPTRDRVARGIDVLITLEARLGAAVDDVREGDLARFNITRPVKSMGSWVPTSALTQGVRGLWSVYVIDEGESKSLPTLRRADVELLHTESDRAYVRTTLPPETRVVAEGLHRLAPRMRVRPSEQTWTDADASANESPEAAS